MLKVDAALIGSLTGKMEEEDGFDEGKRRGSKGHVESPQIAKTKKKMSDPSTN